MKIWFTEPSKAILPSNAACCTVHTKDTWRQSHLDVCVEKQLVGAVGKPQSLNVLQGLDVVQHHVGRNEVHSQAQSCPP